MENHRKIKNVYEPDSRFGSRLRVGKVLAPHNARPEMIPFHKMSINKCGFTNVIFLKQ